MASSSLNILSVTPTLQSLAVNHSPHTVSFASLPRLAYSLPSVAINCTVHRQPKLVRNVAVSSDLELEDEENEAGSDFSGDSSVVDEASYSPELKLFVGNLPFNVDSAALAGLFERAGNVEMVEVIYDKRTGRSRGFGFITMSTPDEVATAVQQFNGYEILGRAIRVNAGPPPVRESSPYRASRGGGGSSGFNRGNNKVYVGNLAWGVDNHALETLFSKHGEVKDARVVYDRDSGRSKGYGFVTYGSAREVANAIESLDGVDLDGRSIRVIRSESRPRRDY